MSTELVKQNFAVNKKNATWLPVVGYEGIYEVSDKGDIKSIARKIIIGNGNCSFLPEKIMKQKSERNGYRRIKLCNNGNFKTLLVHRIVASSFLKNPEIKKTVNHKNGIRHDNRIENLEWTTNSENQIHSFKNGRVHIVKKRLSTEQIKEVIKFINNGLSQAKIAKMYSVSQPTISNYLKNYHGTIN